MKISLWNDGLMIIFNIVLRDDAVILDALFSQEIGGVCFLQKRITDIFFIPQNLIDGAVIPSLSASSGEYAIRFQMVQLFFSCCSLPGIRGRCV
jgi:hypothetical protein